MSTWKPKRGDIVLYHDACYFFQPSGTRCYLYREHDLVGLVSCAALEAPFSSISPAPLERVELHMKEVQRLKVPAKSYVAPRRVKQELLPVELDALHQARQAQEEEYIIHS